jgi:eukaryotic-like serine/threonine-protein kinase
VQHWLADLARELEAASADGSLPVLALDRVWITRGGQARLLDFAAPGLEPASVAGSGDAIADPQRFLARAAAHALGAGSESAPARVLPHGPLPRLAQLTLDTLERSGFPSLAAGAERAAALTEGLDEVTRPRRAASILLANVPLFFALLALSIGLPTAVRLLETQFLEMSRALVEIRTLDGKTDQESVKAREALELYVADRFGPELTDERTWHDPRSAGLLTPLRPIAARILAGTSSPSDEERRAAHAAAAARLGNPVSLRRQAVSIAALLPAIVLLVSAIVAVLSATLFRGGLLLRSLGVAVVSARGSDASRVRAAWRAIVAWSPVLLLWLYVLAWSAAGGEVFDAFSNWWVPAAAAAVAILGSGWAILHPSSGAAERLTGTCLVPR